MQAPAGTEGNFAIREETREESWKCAREGAADPPRASSRGGVLALASLLLLACGEPRPTNVLWIVSDTFRADALDCDGARQRTPNLCALAARGTRFENARSNASWTLASSVSMLTGKFPSVFGREVEESTPKNEYYYVDDEELLLAEALAARGYENVAFVENALALKPNSFQGFELRSPFQASTLEPALVARLGLDLRDARDRNLLPVIHYLHAQAREPFFAVEWIMDPHSVYDPPEHLYRTLDVDPSRLPHPLAYYRRLAQRDRADRGWVNFNRVAPEMSDYEMEVVRRLYLKEVASVDERVGRILEVLEERGFAERTLVIFTSDHGEGFFEHGKVFHANGWYYEEFVHIPWVLAGPGVPAGHVVSQPVSLVDLVPTVADLLGVEELVGLQGSSTRGLLRGDANAAARIQYCPGLVGWNDAVALSDGRHKLILRPEGTELYDLREDPGERENLAADRPDVVRALEGRIAALRAEDRRRRLERPHTDADILRRTQAETLDQLRALGYVEP